MTGTEICRREEPIAEDLGKGCSKEETFNLGHSVGIVKGTKQLK